MTETPSSRLSAVPLLGSLPGDAERLPDALPGQAALTRDRDVCGQFVIEQVTPLTQGAESIGVARDRFVEVADERGQAGFEVTGHASRLVDNQGGVKEC